MLFLANLNVICMLLCGYFFRYANFYIIRGKIMKNKCRFYAWLPVTQISHNVESSKWRKGFRLSDEIMT